MTYGNWQPKNVVLGPAPDIPTDGTHTWVDEQTPYHGIRVVCSECGKFYGYRDKADKKRTAKKVRKT